MRTVRRMHWLTRGIPCCLGLLMAVVIVEQMPAQNAVKSFRAAFPLDALRSVTQGDAKVAAEILIRKIVEEQGYAYSTVIPKDHEEFIPQMKAMEYDFFLMYGYEYLAYREAYGIRPILVGLREQDSPLSTFILVTKKDRELKDVRGKLMVQKGSGTLPLSWLNHQLEVNGLEAAASHFETISEVENVSQAVLPVFFGKADAGLVTLDALEMMAELNPQLNTMLERMLVSEPMLTSVLCVRRDYPADDEKIIRDISVKMHERPDGGQILTLMRVEKLIPFAPDYLASLERFVAGCARKGISRKEAGDGAP